MINSLFEYFSGRELKDNEEYRTFHNEYNELCYEIYDINSGEIIESNAF